MPQHHGCIEDRMLNQEGNVFQAPGGDLFFTSLRDLTHYANRELDSTRLLDSVIRDATEQPAYALHNDEDHGEFHDGCGYAAEQQAIYEYLGNNIHELIERINADKAGSIPEDQQARIAELAQAATELAQDEMYFSVTGGELVKQALKKQPNIILLTYIGDHTAPGLTIDETPDQTYEPDDANNPDTESNTTFNVDADDFLADKATAYDLDGEIAKSFVKVLSLATVDVLSGSKAPVSHK